MQFHPTFTWVEGRVLDAFGTEHSALNELLLVKSILLDLPKEIVEDLRWLPLPVILELDFQLVQGLAVPLPGKPPYGFCCHVTPPFMTSMCTEPMKSPHGER